MPFRIAVTIYNEAGEVVRHLFTGVSQLSPSGFNTSVAAFVGNQGSVSVGLNGKIQGESGSLVWTGTNDNGQGVSGGIYYITVQSTDPFGAVQSWTKAVTVLPPPAQQTLDIYNSAGELVIQLNTAQISSLALTNVGFSNAAKSAAVLGPGLGVDFLLQDTSGRQISYVWNGENGQGSTVAPGSYIIQLVNSNGGRQVVTTKGFEILAAPLASSFNVTVGPNPIGIGDRQLVFGLRGLGFGQGVTVKLYSLDGELITQGLEAVGSQQVVIKVGNWSGGIYMAVIELRQGEMVLERKFVKVAVSR